MKPQQPVRSHGFSIVELMVAMTLSLVLLSGVLGVLYSSKVTYSENERLARLQESARAAVEMILRDMRSGGFQGCGKPLVPQDFENMLLNPTTLTHNYALPLQGFDGSTGAFSPAIDAAIVAPLLPSDVVVIRGLRPGVPSYRTNALMATGNSAVTIDKPAAATIALNTPVMISNCERSTVFAVTGFTNNGTTASIAHAQGASGVTNSNANIGAFPRGSVVSPLNTIVYYVSQPAGRAPALWRKVDDGAGVELIPGIERLEILYGEDTNGDLLADRYVPASQAGINWTRITSASISVLVRSVEEYGAAQTSRQFAMLGTNVGPFNDRFMRAMFSTTASLRNRTQ
jgi:type IV pilus assembly protein PilW